eukprot:scaffold12093_cov137-Isochrysis_galbana.AAC.4
MTGMPGRGPRVQRARGSGDRGERHIVRFTASHFTVGVGALCAALVYCSSQGSRGARFARSPWCGPASQPPHLLLR